MANDDKGAKMAYEALGSIPSVRVLEHTVDWCQGSESQTVLRTLDRAEALKLHDKLHACAVRLNALGVDVCVEMSSETKLVPAAKPGKRKSR